MNRPQPAPGVEHESEAEAVTGQGNEIAHNDLPAIHRGTAVPHRIEAYGAAEMAQLD